MKKKIKCEQCNKEASFFHSKCCNAHFEGVITKENKFVIVCEKCGRFVAKVENPIINQ